MSSKGHPSYRFTRDELRAFAVAGMRQTIRKIELQLARIFNEFPEVFISKTAPVLLKAEPREDGKDWGGARAGAGRPTATPRASAALKKAWTPKRRREQSARMRKLQKRGHMQTKAARGGTAWQKMRAALQAAPRQRATAAEIREATGLTHAALANSVTSHADLFTRVEPGVYQLTAAGKKASENGATAP